MTDLAGLEMAPEEREMLCHPLVGGVILFARNYADPEQVTRLTARIRELRRPPLVVAVDHEGGRVQRFRSGFTPLPPMRRLGDLWDQDRPVAWQAARSVGLLIGAELRSVGVDLSFAPVLDLDFGSSAVIGDRAFHSRPQAVTELAGALVEGLAEAGMGAVGKHFPGHGFVVADSHLAIPVDERSPEEIFSQDLLPFQHLAGRLAGVMPAHVIYPRCDPNPAGFSRFWLAEVLRHRLRFGGVVFSDDLSMEGASVAGSMAERAQAARAAGCDMVLVCNAPAAAREVLEQWRPQTDASSAARLSRLKPDRRPAGMVRSLRSPACTAARERVRALFQA
ncbi:MAG: beta-N-acetylhexosaminidase [Betaproteobacteria bacterium]|nr:beta-N-acetylhexosaminidase [Betaproteobacteria bacterium]